MGLMTSLRGGAETRIVATSDEASRKAFSTGFSAQGYIPPLGSMPAASGVLVSQATALQVSAVYACVRIRSRDLARCTPQILRDDGAGNKTVILDHPLAALFKQPNAVQTWFEFSEQLHIGFLLRSNAYAVILRDYRGNPVALIPINPDLVTVMEAPDGSLFYNVARAGMWLAAVLADEAIMVPAADMLHIRDLSFNSLVGVSRIALARDAIGLAMTQEQQASRWSGNGARPAGVLQSKKTLSQDAADRLKNSWEKMQAGIQNTGRTAVLEDGIEWKAMALTSVDLEFNAARLIQVKEIARFYEVPLHKLGENESLPRASISELNADYVQNVVMSDATRWEQKIEATFGVTGLGYEIKFDERGLLRADLSTMINSARAGVMSGLITQNEGRAYIGYGPVANADKLLAPVNLAPSGSALDGVAPDGVGRPRDGGLPGDAKGLAVGSTAAAPDGATVAAIARAVVAALKGDVKTFDPDQPRDDHGRWGGGGTTHDGGSRSPDHATHDYTLSEGVKAVVAGLVVTAAAPFAVAFAMAVVPEGVVAVAATAAIKLAAEKAADHFFAEAGFGSAKVILGELGVTQADIDRVTKPLTDIFKNVLPAVIDAALARALPVVADHARDTLIATLRKEHAGAAALDSVIATIGKSCAAYKAEIEAIVHPPMVAKANPHHDERGRFTTADGANSGHTPAKATDFAVEGVELDRGTMNTRDAVNTYNSFFKRPPAALRGSLLKATPGISIEKSTISVSTAHDNVRMLVVMRNNAGVQIATMSRIFRPDFQAGSTEKAVEHESFYVNAGAQGAGIAKAVLANSIAEYQAMNVSRVSLVAGDEVGGYAWARYGFVPRSRSAWQALVPEIKGRLDEQTELSDAVRDRIGNLLRSDDPTTIRKISDLRMSIGDGRKLGQALLLGTMWNGTLSLRDKTAMARFKRYVRR